MTIEVLNDDQLVGRGIYRPKKQIAHSRAAKDVLENIENILGDKEHIWNAYVLLKLFRVLFL